MDARISKLCERAFATRSAGLYGERSTANFTEPAKASIWKSRLMTMSALKVQEYVANYINADWIGTLTATSERGRRLSPPAFRYQLTDWRVKPVNA